METNKAFFFPGNECAFLTSCYSAALLFVVFHFPVSQHSNLIIPRQKCECLGTFESCLENYPSFYLMSAKLQTAFRKLTNHITYSNGCWWLDYRKLIMYVYSGIEAIYSRDIVFIALSLSSASALGNKNDALVLGFNYVYHIYCDKCLLILLYMYM